MSVFEVCIDNIESIQNALTGGADRLELCSALSEGGLTPSLAFVAAARQITGKNFPIFPMIRPRGGNFVYAEREVDIMESDIKHFKGEGADGFVFGLLTKDKTIDVPNCKRLIEAANPLPVTFHRAFDEIESLHGMLQAVDNIIDLGFSRLLTSGGCRTAEEGIDTIIRVVQHSRGRLKIMPGAGISPKNLGAILAATKVDEFHGSAKGAVRDDGLIVTSESIVRKMKDLSMGLSCKQN